MAKPIQSDPTEPTKPTQAPSMPSIPDRKTKPVYSKTPSTGVNGIVDDGDYVQLHIPNSLKDPSNFGNVASNRFEDETQKVFDKTVSNHIEMRDRLASIGEKFRSVGIGDDGIAEDWKESGSAHQSQTSNLENDASSVARYKDLLTKLEDKEEEIRRMQKIQSLRKMKPPSGNVYVEQMLVEEDKAKIASLEKEVDSLTRRLESKERALMDAEVQARLATVERLRQERKMREAQSTEKINARDNNLDNGERVQMGIRGGARPDPEPEPDYLGEEGTMRRSQSTPFINKTPENEELPPITPTLQQPVYNLPPKANIPVPDRSMKPPTSTRLVVFLVLRFFDFELDLSF